MLVIQETTLSTITEIIKSILFQCGLMIHFLYSSLKDKPISFSFPHSYLSFFPFLPPYLLYVRHCSTLGGRDRGGGCINLRRQHINIPQADPTKRQKCWLNSSKMQRKGHTPGNIISDFQVGVVIRMACGAFLITNSAQEFVYWKVLCRSCWHGTILLS